LPIVLVNLNKHLAQASVRAGEVDLRPELDVSYVTYPLEKRTADEVLALENRTSMGRLSEVAEAFAAEEGLEE
jgi:hypothetical protein